MNQGTQGYSLTKKTEGRKSRDTVSLRFTCINNTITTFIWPSGIFSFFFITKVKHAV
jgi:hypothetical protein